MDRVVGRVVVEGRTREVRKKVMEHGFRIQSSDLCLNGFSSNEVEYSVCREQVVEECRHFR